MSDERSTTTTKKTTMRLPVKLTEHEIDQRATEMAKQVTQAASIEAAKKTAVADFNEKIKACEGMVATLAGVINDRTEERMVDCMEVHDFRMGKVTIWRKDTMEVVDERAMNIDERQLSVEDVPALQGSGDDPMPPVTGNATAQHLLNEENADVVEDGENDADATPVESESASGDDETSETTASDGLAF